MKETKFVKFFEELSKNDVKIAGGKGASLGEMRRVGIPVPPGFVVLACAFDEFLKQTDLNVEIEAALNKVRELVNFRTKIDPKKQFKEFDLSKVKSKF